MSRRVTVVCALTLAAGFAILAGAGGGEILLPVRDGRTHAFLRARAISDDPAERVEAAVALGQIADPEDAALLQHLASDADPRVRAEAVFALGRTDALGLTEMAGTVLGDDRPEVRASFFRSIEPQRLSSGWAERGLNDDSDSVRAAAARVASRNDMASLLEARMESDPSMHVRVAAWDRLMQEDDEARARALRFALAHRGTEFFVRGLRAVRAGDEVDASALHASLQRSRGAELVAAVEAVGRARMEAAIPAMLARMETYEALARRVACEGLAEFDLPGVVRMLGRRLAQDPDPAVAQAAARALTVHPSAAADAALLAILQLDRPYVLIWTLNALADRGTHGGADAAVPLLSHKARTVRTAAMNTIRRLDPTVARPHVERIREAADGYWTHETPAALRLLTAMGYRGHADIMKDRLVRISYDMPHEVRVASLEGLIALGLDEMTARCIRIATDTVVPPPPGESGWSHDFDDVRIMALRYLARFADPTTLERVLRAFEETPPYPVRVALAELVSQWTGGRYEAVPRTTHIRYSVESLDPPAYDPTVPPPGIRRVGER